MKGAKKRDLSDNIVKKSAFFIPTDLTKEYLKYIMILYFA